jgi:fused signal recognition particle receptor
VSSSFFKRFRRGNKDEQAPEAVVDEANGEEVNSEGANVEEAVAADTEAREATDHSVVTDSTDDVIEQSAPSAAETDTAMAETPAASGSTEEKPQEESGGFFSRFRKSSNEPSSELTDEEEPAEAPVVSVGEKEKPEVKQGFFARIRAGLSRTSSNFAEGLGNLFLGRKEIDEDLLEDIETQLLVADVGLDATTEIIDKLTDGVARKQLADADALYGALKGSLVELLQQVEAPLVLPEKAPAVILVVGVNGVGKTTTIGKLAKRFQSEGKSVMLAAGDTFRAAAVEQLQVWGERNQVPVVAQHTGADSASVIFDAIASAQNKGIDIIIADTAGRLHNKSHLMDELAKVKRVMAKLDDSAPHEVLLVLDAGTGQNAINQAEHFIEAAGVTGIALTKLDGTAKGGVIFALSQKFGLPVRFIGVGEGIDDLQPFDADAFVQALFNESSPQ